MATKAKITNKKPTAQELDWVMWSHLSGLLAGFIFPLGNIIAPAIIMNMKQADSEFVKKHAKESLNFQITITIGTLICIVLMFVIIGIPLLLAMTIVEIFWVVQAIQTGRKGEMYNYPFNFRFIK